MEIEFIDPTPAIAAHQRASSLECMVRTLQASSEDMTEPRSVSIILAKAAFDPFLISLLGGQAAKIARTRKGSNRSLS